MKLELYFFWKKLWKAKKLHLNSQDKVMTLTQLYCSNFLITLTHCLELESSLRRFALSSCVEELSTSSTVTCLVGGSGLDSLGRGNTPEVLKAFGGDLRGDVCGLVHWWE